MSFMTFDWSVSPAVDRVAHLLRYCIEDGSVDVHARITRGHASIGSLMPLSAAFKYGNYAAVRVLLDAGCKLEGPMKDFGFKDAIECARSFGKPNSKQVAAVVAEKTMKDKLGAAEGAGSGASLVAVVKARRRAGV